GALGTLEDGCHSEILAAIRKKRWFAHPATTKRLTISGGPKKLPTIPLGRLSRPRPFSQLGFSKVAPGLLLVMIDFALDPLAEVRKCAEIMRTRIHFLRLAMAPDAMIGSSEIGCQIKAGMQSRPSPEGS